MTPRDAIRGIAPWVIVIPWAIVIVMLPALVIALIARVGA